MNFSSHITSGSDLGYTIGDSIFQRPLAGHNRPNRINDTPSFNETIYWQVKDLPGHLPRWKLQDPWKLRYIDDGLSSEVLCNLHGRSHFTQHKETKMIHAKNSEHYLHLTAQNSQKIGMKIHEHKTKLLCISVAKSADVNVYMNLPDGKQVTGSDELKMLGFVFGRRPNAWPHINHIKKKFFAKLWVIRHMIKANTSKTDLCKIYESYILPVIEFCSVVYHHLLSQSANNELENMQAIALKTIFGSWMSYSACLKKSGLTTLEKRCGAAFLKFNQKIEENERFSQAWLKKNAEKNLRRQETYKITKSNYDRLLNGPLNQMRRLLNDEK